jgi:cellulose synthase/poly-beta-1,6-N-acetylglucosamine synthase-like glycosyltransferase
MEWILAVVCWLCFLGLAHSYLFYPLILIWLGRNKEQNSLIFESEDSWPFVSVLLSVYNEEKVIEEKLDSLLGLEYPQGRLHIYIGSDCSSDRTNEIVDGYARQYPHLHFFPFENRRGKPGVVNELFHQACQRQPAGPQHLLLVTDASVILQPLTLERMARHFKNPAIGMVDSHIIHTGMKQEGISRAENQYISTEARLKELEGRVWGKMIGPFGGCYAIRSNYFSRVPDNYLVDDFYITMRMFEKGGQAINDLDAICYEGVSHEISEEYRRKSRISAGNFQNMATFRHLWWPPFSVLGFAFFSHKVLRWIGPILMIFMLLSVLGLSLYGNLFYTGLLALLGTVFIILPVLDYLLRKMGVNSMVLRSIRYFILMNAALLEGFIKYLKGIRSNVWEPTKRN